MIANQCFQKFEPGFFPPDHIDLLDSLFLHREQLSGIISVLYEVYTKLTPGYGEKPELYVPYNILPLDPGGAQQAIMQLPEVRCYMNKLQSFCICVILYMCNISMLSFV